MNTPASTLEQKHNMREFAIEQEEKREDDIEKEAIQQKAESEIDAIKEEPEYQKFFSDEYGNGCPICLLPFCNLKLGNGEYMGYHITNTYDNTPLEITTCKHVFHYDCLRKYCSNAPENMHRRMPRGCKCPLCRIEFDFFRSTQRLRVCNQFADQMNAVIRKYRQIYEEWLRAKKQERFLQKMMRERENIEERRNFSEAERERVSQEQDTKLATLREKYEEGRRRERERRVRLDEESRKISEDMRRAREPTASDFEREFSTGFSGKGGKKKTIKRIRKKTIKRKRKNKIRTKRQTKPNL